MVTAEYNALDKNKHSQTEWGQSDGHHLACALMILDDWLMMTSDTLRRINEKNFIKAATTLINAFSNDHKR